MSTRITLKDVARAAGVATVTASYALNYTGSISERTGEHVRSVAAELGYRSHFGAASLRRQHTSTFGVLIPTLANPFYSELVEALETASRARGFSILGGTTKHDPRLEKHYTDLFLGRRYDGLIIIASMNRLDEIIRSGVPTVLVNSHQPPEFDELPFIEIEELSGVCSAVTHLIGLGHRRIAFVASPQIPLRLAGYCEALASAGIPFDSDLVATITDVDHPNAVRVAVQSLLEQHPDVTAVAAENDIAAIGAIRAAHLMGRRVPDNLAVTGFDDIGLAANLVPALTTVSQPIDTIANCALDLLLEQVDKDGRSGGWQRTPIATKLIIRESCGAPPAMRSALNLGSQQQITEDPR